MSDVLRHFQGHMGGGDGSISNKIATVRRNLEKYLIPVLECLHHAQVCFSLGFCDMRRVKMHLA